MSRALDDLHRQIAREAQLLRAKGMLPGPGAVLTPLAKEILEGTK